MQTLVLKHTLALGDTVLFTGLVRDIHRAYPGRFKIVVDSHFREVWNHNPYASCIRPGDNHERALRVQISYREGIRASSQGIYRGHMFAWYHRDFQLKTGLRVPVTEPKGDLHLLDAELSPIVQGRYWLLMAGGKLDLTNKFWRQENWQSVVDRLAASGIHCVQAGAKANGHVHYRLNNTLNLVGQYPSAREFFNLVRNAEGVICPVTAAMHVAACFDKPCVVIAGGREEPWWEAYSNIYNAFGPSCEPVKVPHRFLHTIDQLACCHGRGCWKKRTVPLDVRDKGAGASTLCRLPVTLNGQSIAKCMDMITPEQVVEAVMSYEHPQVLPVEQLPVLVTKSSTIVEAARPVTTVKHDVLDHPVIGGKITICVLCFGNYPKLARKCVGSILQSVPRDRVDLRIAGNAVCPETRQYLESVGADKLYLFDTNRKKYPVMRDMFFDAQLPLTTKYLVWFDDDTQVIDPLWLTKLGQTIITNHPHNCRLYGWRMLHDLRLHAGQGHRPDTWFRQAPWYRGKHFRVRGQGKEAPNGSIIEFVLGWCWAISTDVIQRGNVPDSRLGHNGGDITIGEQVHQLGYKIASWNKDKRHVTCPTREQGGRRGYSESFPWANPAKARG